MPYRGSSKIKQCVSKIKKWINTILFNEKKKKNQSVILNLMNKSVSMDKMRKMAIGHLFLLYAQIDKIKTCFSGVF